MMKILATGAHRLSLIDCHPTVSSHTTVRMSHCSALFQLIMPAESTCPSASSLSFAMASRSVGSSESLANRTRSSLDVLMVHLLTQHAYNHPENPKPRSWFENRTSLPSHQRNDFCARNLSPFNSKRNHRKNHRKPAEHCANRCAPPARLYPVRDQSSSQIHPSQLRTPKQHAQ